MKTCGEIWHDVLLQNGSLSASAVRRPGGHLGFLTLKFITAHCASSFQILWIGHTVAEMARFFTIVISSEMQRFTGRRT